MSAATGREVELKLRVPDAAALAAIAGAVGGSTSTAVVQTNRFFDTATRALGAARLTLRLRDEDGDPWFLTAKGAVDGAGPDGNAGALKQHLEEEETLAPAVARAIVQGKRSPIDVLAETSSTDGRRALVARLRAVVGAAPLVDVGAFTNRRARVPTTLGGVPVVLELDATTFPGDVVHHEVEVEIPAGADADAVERDLRALLSSVGVQGRSAPGKATRFFAALAGRPID